MPDRLEQSPATRAERPGSLRGRVSDEFGAVIVGAAVTLKDAGGGERMAKTNREGVYAFDKLPPASYVMVVAAASGFATHEGEQVVVEAGRRARLDVKLGVTLGRERVRVSSEAPLDVEPEGNEDAVILRGPGLVALPLNANDQLDALRALAGPTPGGTEVYTDGFSGGRNPPRDSIREVRINQNPFSAEFDRHGAGRIEIFTKPGTGKLRGQASFAGMDASLTAAPVRPEPLAVSVARGRREPSGPLFRRVRRAPLSSPTPSGAGQTRTASFNARVLATICALARSFS